MRNLLFIRCDAEVTAESKSYLMELELCKLTVHSKKLRLA